VSLNFNSTLLYYHPDYSKIQQYEKLVAFENDSLSCRFNILNGIATSLNSSPFGGILIKNAHYDLKEFLDEITTRLTTEQVQKIRIVQPTSYYSGFVSTERLIENGWRVCEKEINQFVSLNEPIQIHRMQKRHLSKQPDFKIRKCSDNEFEKIHRFIGNCRIQQDLKINIPWPKFDALSKQFADRYECFVAEKEGQIISALVMVRPTDNICYYYLPATDAKYKKLSPMVHLLDYLFNYYRGAGFKTMDLGLSSVHGEIQKDLFVFKERMGAKATSRLTLEKVI
jgi:hypothetical protein